MCSSASRPHMPKRDAPITRWSTSPTAWPASTKLPRSPAAANPIEAAIWFHDVVYDTHRTDNERLSAEWAGRVLTAAGVPGPTISRVQELVLATEHAREPADDEPVGFSATSTCPFWAASRWLSMSTSAKFARNTPGCPSRTTGVAGRGYSRHFSNAPVSTLPITFATDTSPGAAQPAARIGGTCVVMRRLPIAPSEVPCCVTR